MRALSRVSLVLLFALFAALPLRGQITYATTPVIDTPGSPDGSYQLSDFESMNIPNGHLNLVFRLASAHGRGNLKLDVIARIESASWSFHPTPVLGNCGPNGCETLGYNYNMTFGPSAAPAPDPLAGVVVQRPTGSLCGVGVMNGLNVSVWTNTTLTSVIWQKPDGTEMTFRDEQFGGQPQPGWHAGINSSQGANRGRLFTAMDGSSAIFTADSNVYDNYLCGGAIPIAVPGVLTLRDGTTYTFRNTQNGPSGTSGAYPTQVEDRNGNLLTIAQGNPELVTDDLNRTITIGGTSAYVQYPGQDGTARNVQVYSSALQNVLNNGETLTLMGNLFGGPNWGCYNGQQCGNSTTYNNPSVISQIVLPNNQGYQFCYNHFGDVARVFLPTGGAIEYDYDTYLTSDAATPTTWTAFRFLIAKRVYNAIPGVTPANTCGADRSTFRLEQQIQYTDALNNPSRTVTYTDANGNSFGSETHYYNPVDLIPGNDGTHYPAWNEGLETEVDYFDASGSLLKKNVNTWHQRPCYSWDVMCVPAWSSNPDGATAWSHDPRMTVQQESYGTQLSEKDFGYANDNVNPYNNQTSLSQYDFGNLVRGNLIRTTTTTYNTSTNYTNLNIVALPLTQTITDASGNQVSSTSWAYDGGTLTNEPGIIQHDSAYSTSFIYRGNPTSVSRVLTDPVNPSHNGTLTTTQTFDIAGNLVDVIDPRGVEKAISYADSLNSYSFPTAIARYPTLGSHTPAITETLAYNYNIARVSTHTDPNGQPTTFSYTEPGNLDRLTTVTRPDTGQSTFTYSDTPGNVNVLTTASMDGTHSLQKAAYFDGLGRVRQSQLVSDPEGITYTDTTYDARGRRAAVTNPHRSSSLSTDGTTSYFYDGISRTCLVVPPDGTLPSGAACPATQPSNTIFTTYSGNTVTVTDQAGKSRKTVSDPLGRLTQVFEDPTGRNYETDYSYDALANLITVNQKGGTTDTTKWRNRTFVYDSLARLVQASNPESGTATYAYDASGNLASKVSPAPNQTGSATITLSFCYDGLNRMTSKGYTAQSCPMSSPAATFVYDATSLDGHTLTNPVGRLVKTATTDGKSTTWNSYDQVGRIANQWQCSPLNCGATPYTKTFVYDFLGDHTSDTYSYTTGTLTISYSYDNAARPLQVTSSLVDSQHPATLATVDSSFGYWPTGALRKISFANGLTETTAYNSRLQPCRSNVNSSGAYFTQCSDAAPSGTVQDFNYGYNFGSSDNGNVASWSATGQQSFSRSFLYDSLNRIASMQETTGNAEGCKPASSPSNPYTLSWTIDAWGNRTNQSPSAGTCSFSQAVDSNNRFFGSPYQYDAAGNMTNDGSHSYTFDAENRVTQVDGGSTGSYVYDADGRRVWKNVGGTTTDYLYDLSDKIFAIFGPGCTAGCWTAGAEYLNGQFLAEYANGTTYFVHKDHLGSSRLLTGLDQSVCDSYDYLPYGEQLTGGNCTILRFTGKERDSESGLDNFRARFFGSSMGRFTRPDPIMFSKQKVVDPQQWSMYAYARNNPLRFLDPTGMYICSGTKEQCAAIKTALDNVRKAANNLKDGSKERKALEKIIGFYGREGDKNGVTTKFGDLGGGANANTDSKNGKTTITFDLNQAHQSFSNRNDGSKEEVEIAGTVAHEGQHGIDDKSRGNPRSEAEEYATEKNAFDAQSWVNKGLDVNSAYTGLWNVNWTTPYSALERIFGVQNWARIATDEWCSQPGAPCQ